MGSEMYYHKDNNYKLCKDCINIMEGQHKWICLSPEINNISDIVSGERIGDAAPCEYMRKDENLCGLSAKYFEQKAAQPQQKD